MKVMKTARTAPAKAKLPPNPLAIKRQLSQLVRQEAAKRVAHARPAKEGYLYLYDEYLREGQYRAILSLLENRLADFEIAGKIVKLTAFTNPRALIEDELRHGNVKNVIITGNDDTVAKVLTRAADLEATFGLLPIGQKKNYLARVLGVPLNEKGVEVLAARKIEKIDYGVINRNRFFLSYLYIPSARAKVSCDKNFSIQPARQKFEMAVANLLPPPFASEKFALHPQDEQMEFYLRPVKGGFLSSFVKGRLQEEASVFAFKHLLITSDRAMTVLADGKETEELSVEVEVAPRKLKMIVGKNRQF